MMRERESEVEGQPNLTTSILDASSLTEVVLREPNASSGLSTCVNIERDQCLFPVKQTLSNRPEVTGNHVDRRDMNQVEEGRQGRSTQGNQEEPPVSASNQSTANFFLQQRKEAIQSMIKYLQSLPPERSFRQEVTDYQFWKSVRTEFLSTFLFVLLTTTITLSCSTSSSIAAKTVLQEKVAPVFHPNKHEAIMLNNGNNLNKDSSIPAETLIIAFVTAALMYTTSNRIKNYRSCHMNPCLTLALFATQHHDDYRNRYVSLPKMILFVVVQLVGSLLASCILFALTFSHNAQEMLQESNERQQMYMTSSFLNNASSSSFATSKTMTTNIFSRLTVPTPVEGLPASNLFGFEFLASFIVILVYFAVTDPSSFKKRRCSRCDKDCRTTSKQRINIKDQDFERDRKKQEYDSRVMSAGIKETRKGNEVLYESKVQRDLDRIPLHSDSDSEIPVRDEYVSQKQQNHTRKVHERRIQHDIKEACTANYDTSGCHGGQSGQSRDTLREIQGVEQAEQPRGDFCEQEKQWARTKDKFPMREDSLEEKSGRNQARNHRETKSLSVDNTILLTKKTRKIPASYSHHHHHFSQRCVCRDNKERHYCFAFVGFAISAAHLFCVSYYRMIFFFSIVFSLREKCTIL